MLVNQTIKMENRMFYPNPEQPNNYIIYVNNNLFNTCQTSAPKRVLINPNFKPNIHVNPNFTAPKHTIHVNPNILQTSAPAAPKKIVPETRKVISTRTKLIRVPAGAETNVKKPEPFSHKSRYKLVKVPSANETRKRSTETHQRYKIDKRKSKDSRSLKKIYQKMVLNKSFHTKMFVINNQVKLSKGSHVSINGVTYKRSPNSLRRSNSLEIKPKVKFLSVYKKVNKESSCTLRRKVSVSKNPFKKVNPKRKSLDVSDKKRKLCNNNSKGVQIKRVMLSYRKILNARVPTNKMKKCNIPCPFYRKFGRCKGKDDGACNRVHNPDQIIVCPKFLQGSCVTKNCLLSHKVSPEKMPTCKYFLEGMCSREDCPYLHVKISPKADICREFLRGFCQKADQCEKRHQYLCPEFEKTAACSKRKCPYPHRNTVRKFDSKLKLPVNRNVRIKKRPKVIEPERTENSEKGSTVRYYEDITKPTDIKDGGEDNVESEFKSRPKIGSLPSFIPFDRLDSQKNDT